MTNYSDFKGISAAEKVFYFYAREVKLGGNYLCGIYIFGHVCTLEMGVINFFWDPFRA